MNVYLDINYAQIDCGKLFVDKITRCESVFDLPCELNTRILS